MSRLTRVESPRLFALRMLRREGAFYPQDVEALSRALVDALDEIEALRRLTTYDPADLDRDLTEAKRLLWWIAWAQTDHCIDVMPTLEYGDREMRLVTLPIADRDALRVEAQVRGRP